MLLKKLMHRHKLCEPGVPIYNRNCQNWTALIWQTTNYITAAALLQKFNSKIKQQMWLDFDHL